MTVEQKVARILANGGSIFMHKNDLERVKEAAAAGYRPMGLTGVKIYEDKFGAIKEGCALAATVGGDSVGFKLNED